MDAAELREFDLEMENNVTVLTFRSKQILDSVLIGRIKTELLGLIQDGIKIVLDYKGVTYQSSEMLQGLIRTDTAIKKAKGKWRFCNMHPDIYEVLAVTRLNKLFDIKATRYDALLDF